MGMALCCGVFVNLQRTRDLEKMPVVVENTPLLPPPRLLRPLPPPPVAPREGQGRARPPDRSGPAPCISTTLNWPAPAPSRPPFTGISAGPSRRRSWRRAAPSWSCSARMTGAHAEGRAPALTPEGAEKCERRRRCRRASQLSLPPPPLLLLLDRIPMPPPSLPPSSLPALPPHAPPQRQDADDREHGGVWHHPLARRVSPDGRRHRLHPGRLRLWPHRRALLQQGGRTFGGEGDESGRASGVAVERAAERGAGRGRGAVGGGGGTVPPLPLRPSASLRLKPRPPIQLARSAPNGHSHAALAHAPPPPPSPSQEKNMFDKTHQETFGRSGCRRIVPGQFLAADPKASSRARRGGRVRYIPLFPP